MSRACALLLPRVCAALADPRQSGPDDTCLEKLLDWFRELRKAEPTAKLLRDNPCLTKFFTAVLALPEPEPKVLSFTLRLAGIVAAAENSFVHLQRLGLLAKLFGEDGPLKRAAWEDASVRSGWVEGMHSMVQHQSALHFICSGGGIDVVFVLQGDPSLFVASAARCLLVHLLTHSVGPELIVPLDAKDCDWPACAHVIIKHIEDSLQSNSASHVKQSLKLLTSLFGSCHAPWTKVLWLGVAKQVESFLTEDSVQAQHILVDLLLNMARSAVFREDSFWALVTSALEHLTPEQSGALAVGILKIYPCPQVVTIKALTVLFQPMECILRAASVECSGLLYESVSDPSAVESLLSSKSSCASFLCQTLAHLGELLSVEKVFLPRNLPYTSLLCSVMTTLLFCKGLLTPATPLGSKISQILAGCFRVQKAALDVLAAFPNCNCTDTTMRSLFDVLLIYLESPNTPPTVLKKSFKAMSKWLRSSSGVSFFKNKQQADKILREVFLVLQKRLCSPCWEVRDSSLEFFTSLIRTLADRRDFRKFLLFSEMPKRIENLLEDPESYVRASAVTAMGQLAYIIYVFVPQSRVAGSRYNKEKTAAKLQEVLSTDPEVFPRRAVMSVFTMWVKESCTGKPEETEQFVTAVVQTAARDLDWEVKLGCLELVQIFCTYMFCQLGLPECYYAPVSPAVTSSVHENKPLQMFCRANLFSFLFRSLCDCDKPVAQKACDILLSLKSQFYQSSTTDSQGTGDLPAGHGIHWLQRTLRQGSLVQNFPTGDGSEVDFQDPESMMLALGTINLVELHSDLKKGSDYVEKSPQSLLEDILAIVGTVEENEADCY
ncbi:BRCA1-associated ATM activator 1 [Centrocercus urophasianus]|uniref:BRCA1-associated ATM activator 1 n=1 Tax=Centrocercus urophasianus TaxID=9002 RepID=UPI001C65154A|nr:BRCA1-associated ATM activator 1 [Centrocercus urophasianus]